MNNNECDMMCFERDTNGTIKNVCALAPCSKMMTKFGKHERIVENYIIKGYYGEAYYYLQDLLSGSYIDCDADAMQKVRVNNPNPRLEDYPPGCRVFKISNIMKEERRIIRKYEQLKIESSKEELSRQGKKELKEAKRNFESHADAILDILKHLVVDERYKSTKREREHNKLLELYDTALKAHKEGIQVENGIGTALESGFQKASRLSGLTPGKKTREARQSNKRKMNQIKNKEKNDKIKEKIKSLTAQMEEMEEKGIDTTKIKQEIQRLLEKLRSGD
jgi:hypothetical protein